ncbi:MAG: hypothetical protein KGK07_16460, partial [Chloroflexota bacterium]|nr:hypothetical protein [Chloroflexota bacterium]
MLVVDDGGADVARVRLALEARGLEVIVADEALAAHYEEPIILLRSRPELPLPPSPMLQGEAALQQAGAAASARRRARKDAPPWLTSRRGAINQLTVKSRQRKNHLLFWAPESVSDDFDEQ